MVAEHEARERLTADPGDPVFADYADDLRQSGKWGEALETALRGLSANPECNRGRLVLARIFYERGLTPFAAREIEYLRRVLPENRSLTKLHEKLAPGSAVLAATSSAAAQAPESTVAEGEFDLDDLDV